MRVVYLDSLVLLNAILDYLLLLLAGKAAGEPLRRWRIALGAGLGALYAGAVVWPGWPFLAHPLVRIAVGAVMVLAAYCRTRRLLRLILLFFAFSAALGGGLFALSYLGMGLESVHGVPVPTFDIKLILLFSAGAYCVLSVVSRKLARHRPRELCQVDVRVNGAQVRLTALVDSGNTLSDPVTGQGVVVAEGEMLQALLPPEADPAHPAQCFPLLKEPERFRLLPYRAVGVEQGLLLALRADSVQINGRDLGRRLVALSPTPVSDTGRFQALFYSE